MPSIVILLTSHLPKRLKGLILSGSFGHFGAYALIVLLTHSDGARLVGVVFPRAIASFLVHLAHRADVLEDIHIRIRAMERA